MQPEKRDAGLLYDMLQFCEEAVHFVSGVQFEQYAANPEKRRAVELVVALIGEAASKVSDAFRDAHPEIPWRQIIGQRHVVIHGYAVLDPARIWKVATADVPQLRDDLRRFLA